MVKAFADVFREMLNEEKLSSDEVTKNEALSKLKRHAFNRFNYYTIWHEENIEEPFEKIRYAAPRLGWLFKPHTAVIGRIDSSEKEFSDAVSRLATVCYDIYRYVDAYKAYVEYTGDDEFTGDDMVALLQRYPSWLGKDDGVYSLEDGEPA